MAFVPLISTIAVIFIKAIALGLLFMTLRD